MANGLFNLKQVNQAISQSGWPNQATPSVQYLVVAGGGGGGGAAASGGTSHASGGGGAGGLLQGILPITVGSAYTVTVGTGGAAGTGSVQGTNGVNSVFGPISATGGGGGGYGGQYDSPCGTFGGSGGGGSRYDASVSYGVSGQGNGGGGGTGTGNYGGGGGGGAGSAGLSASNYGANGGAGISSTISGTVTSYAGGGGGGGYNSNTGGLGGVGGGGAGGGAGNGTAGTANTGGGGGGSLSTGTTTGGAGGSGIVIVSYPDTYKAPTATTGSPTVSTSGSGSLSFNGTSQYLSFANNAANNLGTGSFTIEAFIYPSNFSSLRIFGAQGNPSTLSQGWGIAVNTSAAAVFYMNGSAVLTSTTLTANNWYHVAVVRNGTAIAMYLNGTLVASGTNSANIDYGGDLGIGSESYGNAYFAGNISNFRIVKGTAVYTAAFTPLTAPLTPVSGTGLLLNTVSGAYLVDSSTNSFRPNAVGGSVAWNQLSPFATGAGYKNRVYTWTSSGSITF